ncbi:pyridoxamine 5'-phosphate oxidase-related protein [Nonlabens dokdonensis DSW-6]|uniref:Pyridoxamine 5'-phosphate oxidase-related protein n=1 Tax=Nonlabens dokdonensis (strain DSM 17205 / KCTC 12402 / DSW-6) TaxID=592029 RepID=L7WF46_NONDD|nr:pyridoxamine 5'-phosphate oxidase-related protein [Nonlabens dokdonensis DSW-6]
MRGALHKKRHPFKYLTLSTVDEHYSPRSRTVVLREVSESLECIFFTDARSEKVEHLNSNNSACILAYHPKKLMQLRLDGTLVQIDDPNEIKRLFQKVSEKAIKDYTTSLAPGSAIANPDHVEYVPRKENHFKALRFVPHAVEYLRLKRPNHLRAIFKSDDDWKGQWLVP